MRAPDAVLNVPSPRAVRTSRHLATQERGARVTVTRPCRDRDAHVSSRATRRAFPVTVMRDAAVT